jgi:hypothetical protein
MAIQKSGNPGNRKDRNKISVNSKQRILEIQKYAMQNSGNTHKLGNPGHIRAGKFRNIGTKNSGKPELLEVVYQGTGKLEIQKFWLLEIRHLRG